MKAVTDIREKKLYRDLIIPNNTRIQTQAKDK